MASKSIAKRTRREVVQGLGRLALVAAGALLLAACDDSSKQSPQKPGY